MPLTNTPITPQLTLSVNRPAITNPQITGGTALGVLLGSCTLANARIQGVHVMDGEGASHDGYSGTVNVSGHDLTFLDGILVNVT